MQTIHSYFCPVPNQVPEQSRVGLVFSYHIVQKFLKTLVHMVLPKIKIMHQSQSQHYAELVAFFNHLWTAYRLILVS